ncbi:MAG TPA: FecR domain-containing protein [Steroidobacteraceae bacterium]|nr:FecR domain-containing protein [Steroidobacteraceae bacterium]
MTDRIDENPPLTIPEQAAEWLLRWHCGDLTVAERFAYLQWLKTSPVHIAETLRMCRMYSWLQATNLELFITNEDNFSNIVALPPRESDRKAARSAHGASLWRARIAAGAFAIALSAAIGLVAKLVWFDHTLRTQASELRSMPLSDGSSISAAPYTRLHHDIGARLRRIRLEQGSALFRVAKDPSRPFVVEAGDVIVQATGTQFAVEHGTAQVRVTVSDGSVMVSAAEDAVARFESVPLVIDEELTISDSGAPTKAHVNAAQKLGWARGRLEFTQGDTVGYAVARFNGFNRIQVKVDDRTAARQMRGTFDANDPASFAVTVQEMIGGSLTYETPEQMRIDPPTQSR